MNVDRASLAFARVCFFVMLFVSTACSRLNASPVEEAAIVAAPPAATAQHLRVDAEQMRELEVRLAVLSPAAPTGLERGTAYWD